MASAADAYRLEDIADAHRMNVALFVPFTIQRLRGDTDVTQATVTVNLRDIGEAGEQQRALRIFWTASSVPAQPLAVQEHTVTEWAALGMTCVVAAVYTRLHLRAVTMQGDRFDYWVSDGTRDYGLEVSGTQTTEVEARHRAKVRQWRENPYGVDGYVVTAGFVSRQVIFSFHRAVEVSA